MSESAIRVPPAPTEAIVVERLECSTCKQMKPKKEYSDTQWARRKNKKTKAAGGIGHCKDCVREQNMMRRYKITAEQFDAMLASQKNVCALPHCRKTIDKTNCHIDHDHHTKKVRGLLCADCNMAMGKMGDQVDKLLGVACYLAKTTESLSPAMKTRTDESLKYLEAWRKLLKSNEHAV